LFADDAYLPTVGDNRNWVLGARADKVWEEIWPDIEEAGFDRHVTKPVDPAQLDVLLRALLA
jgi:CheY-like chemotaxis protein